MKFEKITLILVLILTLYSAKFCFAQQVNIKDIKIDELSDEQLKVLMQRAEAIGYSDLKLEQLGRAQGMKEEEIIKLKRRVEDLRKEGRSIENSTNKRSSSYNRNFIRQLNYPSDTSRLSDTEFEDSKRLLLENGANHLVPKVFGSELFNNQNLTFQPDLNMPTPKGYIIGPNDELLIDVTGDNETSYHLTVSPEGYINVEFIGRVLVGGISIEDATAKLKKALSTPFPGIKNGRTQISLNLGNIRSIKIIIIGEVIKPGSYTLPSLATVFNALYVSGGPNDNGSFRKIEVIRNNRVVSTIDIYDFLLKGMQDNNIGLRDQDVIRVPVFDRQVEIAGEIKRPAIYEVLAGESLQDVLDFAGGFTTRAYTSNIKVFQNTTRERRITDIFPEEFDVYVPRNGDQYVVEGILDRFENRLILRGAVFRPGAFEVKSGLTIKELINNADGLKEDAFLSRAYIYRLKPDNTQELITFNLGRVLDGSATNIVLQREDIVHISSIFDLRDDYIVTIQGEVREPETFPFVENMTIGSLIQMAGGFKEGAAPNRIEVSRRKSNIDVKLNSASAAEVFTINVGQDLGIDQNEFILQPYDIVSVRSDSSIEPQMQVLIEGEVLFPGFYTIKQKNDRISDVIQRSGGLTAFAYPKGASLRRPNKEYKQGSADLGLMLEEEERLENERKLINLQRLSEGEANNTLISQDLQRVVSSDLVGISLDKILDKPNSKWNLYLEDGDIIKVPKALQTVKISGEVLKPNNVAYDKGKNFKKYIQGAGGFTRNASKKGAYIQYANGSVDAAGKFLFFNHYPRVEPGAEIFVPNRGPREKVTAQGWVGISTAIVSMAAMIFSILK